MKEPKIIRDGKGVVIGPVRLSYVHLFKPYATEGGEAKYQTAVLIPKGEKKTVKAIKNAIEKAKEEAVTKKWGGVEPKKWNNPLCDGDEKDDETYADHFYLSAKSKTRPEIVDKHGNPITDEEEIYSGVYACVSMTFFGFDVSGNKGIACGLNNVMKFKDGDYLGGRSSAASDFEGFADDDGEEDDL